MKIPLIMGIVNATPDSFFDGGAYDPFERAARLAAEGAEIIDLGGESTRPGAAPVPLEEEARRVLPVLEKIKKNLPAVKISADTYKADLALEAAALGADIINDPGGMADPAIARVAARYDKKLVIMHTKGTPQTMNAEAVYKNMLREMEEFFEKKIELAVSLGVKRENIIVDPGFGFAKNKEQNLFLLDNLAGFKKFGLPLLIGLSRKRFLGGETAADRLPATLEAAKKAAAYADILRVHDVAETIKYLGPAS